MSQFTLTGEKIDVIAPFSKMDPSEKIIYNYLKAQRGGVTIHQIKAGLAYTKIQIFDNKLRNMRKMGWVRTWIPVPGELQRYYARDPKEVI